MTRDAFLLACNARAVAPEIALEFEEIRKALAERNDALVLALLDRLI